MDDRDAIGIIDDTQFQRLTGRGWSNEHRDVGIVSLEPSPVVPECMKQVVIGDTVLVGARLDVHSLRLRTEPPDVNMC